MPAQKEIASNKEMVRPWEPASGWSGGLSLKNEVEYEFPESPGLYVFQLNARWEKYGDVSYGFLVQVEQTANTPSSVDSQSSSIQTPATIGLNLIFPIMRLSKGAVLTLKPSPNGQWLAIGSSLGVYLFDLTDQKEIWFHQYDSAPRSIAFSPDSLRLAIGLAGSVMPIVDIQTGKTVMQLHGEEGIHGAWSPDGNFLLTSAGCE